MNNRQSAAPGLTGLGVSTDQAEALRQMGFFRPIDAVIILIQAFTWFTAAAWAVFGDPTLVGFLLTAVGSLLVFVVWLILLVYRCSLFVLQTRADINLMPVEAARLAISYTKGQ